MAAIFQPFNMLCLAGAFDLHDFQFASCHRRAINILPFLHLNIDPALIVPKYFPPTLNVP